MKDGGSIWGILLVIILVALGMWWLSGNQSDTVADELETTLDGLKSETQLAFSDVGVVEFKWMFEGEDSSIDDMSVAGKGFEVAGISSDQHQEIRDYFEQQGFSQDLYNMADGITGSLSGYKKNDFLVQVESGVTGGEAGLEVENVTYDVRVRLGKAEVPTVESPEELIAEAFAAKYDKPIEEVAVTIGERIGVFASGQVTFGNGGSEDSGMWLAFNGDDGWEIVFDGNGAVMCADIEPHDFPVEIISECVDEVGNLTQR